MMTPGRGAAVRQALAVDVDLHGRRFIVAEFTAFAVLFAGLSVAIVAAALRRAADGGVSLLGWSIDAAFVILFAGWTTNCVVAVQLTRCLAPTPPSDDVSLWRPTTRLVATLLIPFAATRR